MLGAIAGDIIGSLHEFNGNKSTQFPLFTLKSFFTDDTVLTIATAEKLLRGGDYAALYRKWGLKYPDSGYGGRFAGWLEEEGAGPYNSFGNGSAMRVAPVGWVYNTLTRTLAEAQRSALVTHNHREGVKGAQAVAAAVFLARTGKSKAEIKAYIESAFGYDLSVPVDEIRPFYMFDETCQGSVPQAITCFLESKNYEDAVRKAISLGGDADTQACIAGGIAQAFYGGVPPLIARRARTFLPQDMLAVLDAFEKKFMGVERDAPAIAIKPAPRVKKRPAPRAARGGKRPRVIVLDDDKACRDLFKRALSLGLEAEIFATADPGEALSAARKSPPLLFVTDLVHEMPPDGITLLKALKQDRKTSGSKVWVVSGNVPKIASPAELKKLGADRVFRKPWNLEELVAAARELAG